MFVDSHCHLNRLDLSRHQDSIDLALQAARAVHVSAFLAVAVDLDEHDGLMQLAARHADVGISVGVHPCEDPEMMARATLEQLCQLGQHDKVWAIGETGLDYHYSQQHAAAQRESFARHIQAGKQLGKPVIVHTREARHDTLEVLRAEQAEHGILHCFTEDWPTAKAALDLGYHVSFSGIISFKNAADLREVARQVPLDRLLIETDSPYLAPVPYRGKPNEPAYLPQVAVVLADLHAMSVERLAELTTENFYRLRRDAAATIRG
ncbi:MAG: TatD family hydrolase [Pseudomonadota bacterium]|nr:TatD family hydrolase [Pseudomonadota bacterium]